MKKNTLLLLLSFCFLFVSNLSAQTQLEHQVNFDSDQSALLASSQTGLDKFAMELAFFNEYNIEIIGHTDQDGSLEYNKELSEKRASAVSQYFVDRGIAKENISVRFKGESDLLLQANDEESKSKNRRVEIIAKAYAYQSPEEIISQLQKDNLEIHTLDNKIASVTNMKNGTQVNIPADAFCQLDGSPLESDEIKLTLKEAHNYIDMVDQNLFTQTEDQMIETGGMVFIQAEQNGKLLKLQEGKTIDLLLPRQEHKPGMEVFLGQEDADGVIWEETGEAVSSVEKDELFLQVDLSPVLDFEFAPIEVGNSKLAAMPAYPHPKRKANPPARAIYSQEKYDELYKKYEDVMELHNEYEKVRPAELKEWKEEFMKRRELLLDIQKAYYTKNIEKRVGYYIAKMAKQKNTVSHHTLLADLSKALDVEIGNMPFPAKEYMIDVFGKNYGEVLDNAHFEYLQYDTRRIVNLVPDLQPKIREVEGQIMKKKLEMGYVDENVFGRYLVSTSDLGWINCDRFMEFEDWQLTELMFADNNIDSKYYLVFKDIKSIIRPRKKNGEIVFNGIPRGEKVRLISIGFQGKQAQMAYQDLVVGNKKPINLKHKSARIDDIKRVLSST